ncbi:MAG: CDP-diacylglycerol--glycerol-3-phosphate 3-phosphatidyltransferase [Bacilli bacterium]|nr:CDP-diacylglycerol--glycerol-3-phosphate 3-phosphatidyltransferase [Bacilli bacterium]
MNLPNKLTITRILFTIFIIILFLFPFYQVNFNFPMWVINVGEVIEIDSRYIFGGILFLLASLTDFLDGYLARKKNMVTDFGKFIDAIADKVLVNSVLIIFAVNGVISPIIPVIIIFRDTIVDSIRMMASNKGIVIAAGKAGKVKTACMMVGLTLTFFYNLPFEIWNIDVSTVLLVIATILSVYSGIEYYYNNKKLLFTQK